jgi:hypothetical protein
LDAARHPHNVGVMLKLKGDRLVGYASAMDNRWFALSSFVELKKEGR